LVDSFATGFPDAYGVAVAALMESVERLGAGDSPPALHELPS
jgi:hypothetical protein